MNRRNIYQRFWLYAGSFGIRTKIMGIVAILVIGLGAFMGWYIPRSEAQYLTEQLDERGLTIARSVAAQGQDMVLTNHQFGLYMLASNTLNNNKDVAYVFVTGGKGEVLVHTFQGGFPLDLLGLSRSTHGERPVVTPLISEKDKIRDIAVPILGSRAGMVHVGLDETTVLAYSTEHARHILTITGIALLLGMVVAYGFATILARPISNLELATKMVADTGFSWEAPIWARDEIGRLGESFNDMTKKVAQRTQEIVHKNNELTTLWEELKRKENLRIQLLAKVISAQEEERKRIARELHDETSQSITSLMVGLKVAGEANDATAMRERIGELRSLASHTLEKVRDLSLALRPSVLDDLGLIPALDRYVKEYGRKTGIDIQFESLGAAERRLPPEIETAIYRVIQEALTNIVRHAQASNAGVILEKSPRLLRVIVEDNGKGFDVEQIMSSPELERRLGLFGMEERISLIGGKFSIESSPGKGTTVYVEVPIE